ncbi:MAG TPA: hypothetical protein VNU70_11225 [Puia sp.]|nr:hypothetical protein [Puia sp.]
MADKNWLQDFKDLTDTYTKFMIYHAIVVFIIVFTLINGVWKIQGRDLSDRVRRAKGALRACHSEADRFTQDELLLNMYFSPPEDKEGRPRRRENETDTVTYAGMDSVKAALAAKKCIDSIDEIHVKAFSLRLNFFYDTVIDLRVWIFILPFIFFVSLVYAFILDFKITLVKRLAISDQQPISIADQYPFRFLRRCLILVEALFLVIYTYLLTAFLKDAIGMILTYVYTGYFLLVYYSFVYCCNVAIKMSGAHAIEISDTLTIYRIAARCWKWLYRVIRKIRFQPYLSTGQVLMVLTLFLVMSYDSCDHSYVKGYQLWKPQYYWEEDLVVNNAFIYKYLYIATMLAMVAACCWYFYRSPAHILSRISTWIGSYFFLAACLYSVYFGFYDSLLDALDIFVGVGFFICWYIAMRRTGRGQLPTPRQFGRFVVILAPFILLSLIHCLRAYKEQNGWIYYYLSIWFITIACVVYAERSRDAASEKKRGGEQEELKVLN